jgi:hypothetical protein
MTLAFLDNFQFAVLNRPISLNRNPTGCSKKRIFSSSWSFLQEEDSASGPDLGGSTPERSPYEVTILFIPVSAPQNKLEADWAEDCDKIILRQCPVCKHDSIIGHGRRRKQAHDEYHDWIEVRRGRCPGCGTTFTFLPLFSLPYTHYSLLARCQALWRRLVENCSWEKALPSLKDSNRLPDPSTVRRWSSGLDCSQLALSFSRQMLADVADWLTRSDQADYESGPLSWITPALQILWPLRL